MRKVDRRLNEESARVLHYLSLTTENKLKSVVENELILTHCKSMLEIENSGFISMLKENKIDDLRRIYSLFLRIPICVDQLREAMGDCPYEY
jgi:cullin 3